MTLASKILNFDKLIYRSNGHTIKSKECYYRSDIDLFFCIEKIKTEAFNIIFGCVCVCVFSYQIATM